MAPPLLPPAMQKPPWACSRCSTKDTLVISPGHAAFCNACRTRKSACCWKTVPPPGGPSLSKQGGASGDSGLSKGQGKGKGTIGGLAQPTSPGGKGHGKEAGRTRRWGPPSSTTAQLQAQVAQLQAQLQAAQQDGKLPDSEEPGSQVPSEEEDRAALLRRELKQMEGVTGIDEVRNAKQQELDDLILARRSAQPLDTRIRDAEACQGRRIKALERARSQTKAAREAVAAAKAALEAASGAEAEAQKSLDQIAQELRGLHHQKATAPQPTPGDQAEVDETAAAEAAGRERLAELKATNPDDPSVALLEDLLALTARGKGDIRGGPRDGIPLPGRR